MTEAIGYAGMLLIALCQLPQITKTLRTRRVDGVSVPYYGLLAAGIGCMLVYALGSGLMPFILNNAAALSLVLLQLVLLAKFGSARACAKSARELAVEGG